MCISFCKRFAATLCAAMFTLTAGAMTASAQVKAKIALTFDDGPSKANTAKILDILEVNGAKATFFVIGRNAAENAQLLRRAASLGCEIGNHTFDHAKLTDLSDEKIREQLQKTDEVIIGAIGVRPFLVRTPCGRCSCAVRASTRVCHLNDKKDKKKIQKTLIFQRFSLYKQPCLWYNVLVVILVIFGGCYVYRFFQKQR